MSGELARAVGEPLMTPPSWYLAAYDRRQVYALLRDCTTQHLLTDLCGNEFANTLAGALRDEGVAILEAWQQRALGPMPLRDALIVDNERGERLFAILCWACTAERVGLPLAIAAQLTNTCSRDLTPQDVRDRFDAHLPTAIAPLVERAQHQGLTLVCQQHEHDYPFPTDLEQLLPTLPAAYPRSVGRFEHPTGARRATATLLAIVGALWMGFPLLAGQVPERPAGIPLAFLTLALLVGIRAGWQGVLGSLCIWLVANLPRFHHNAFIALWPDIPLLALGLLLLMMDKRVRTMWGWIRQQVLGRRAS